MLSKLGFILQKFPMLKFLKNRYVLVGILFIIWMFFFDNYSFFEHQFLNKQIEELQNNSNYYKTETAKDSIEAKNLRNGHMTEKYAREKYFMKKDSEDIYIIEYEEDVKKDSITNSLSN
jgi:cell division protein DivIC